MSKCPVCYCYCVSCCFTQTCVKSVDSSSLLFHIVVPQMQSWFKNPLVNTKLRLSLITVMTECKCTGNPEFVLRLKNVTYLTEWKWPWSQNEDPERDKKLIGDFQKTTDRIRVLTLISVKTHKHQVISQVNPVSRKVVLGVWIHHFVQLCKNICINHSYPVLSTCRKLCLQLKQPHIHFHYRNRLPSQQVSDLFKEKNKTFINRSLFKQRDTVLNTHVWDS